MPTPISNIDNVTDNVMSGYIRSLKPKFGFIRSGSDAYFFMPSSVVRENGVNFASLREGWTVEFSPQMGERGPYAINIRVTGQG